MKIADLPPDCLPSKVASEGVELTDIGRDELPEPFYGQALARLNERGRPVRVRVPLDTLARLSDFEGLPGPRGLVFHVGRCGSTLLANMLGANPAVRSVKEPEALNQALLEGSSGSVEPARTVLRAFGRGLPAESGLVVKCTSWNTRRMRQLLAAFPDAPAVFLWRPAVEVVASCLATEPAWAGWRDDPALGETWFPQDPSAAGDRISFYAHAWRSVAGAALEAAEAFGPRVRFVSYAELRQAPGEVATATARYFGLPVSPESSALMAQQATRYSKDPSGTARFDPAGSHSRPQLTEQQRALVEGITGPQEAALSARSRSDG
ncbi:hypothetical protein [Kitasatospora sp. GP82]|uniref:hypothetical protein n=1 Tax=Kitasatospora sp. GP82 TaxID=3035089 RepID=UPI002473AD49|nr:hypothetical protein [Kitasatospora sp. GP82]MDH6129996.1 hypothetical protein [Kitasatospora sp. GP82]